MIIKTKIVDLTDIFKDTKCNIISRNIEKGFKVFGIKLDKFKGLLSFEINPNRRIGSELADIAKVFGLGGIFHSDELPRYGISESEVEKVREKLGCNEEDAFIIISGPEEKCKIVLREIVRRLNEMIKGVPKDTRKANQDGTTSFLRPQPTSARMYPETDHPLIFLNRKKIDKEKYKIVEYDIKINDKIEKLRIIKLKERNKEIMNEIKEKYDFILDLLDPEFRKEILKSYNLSDKIVEDLLWSENLEKFEYLANKFKIKPTIVYYLLEQVWGELKKKGIGKREIDLKVYEKILNLLEEGKIVKDSIPIILENYIKEGKGIEKIVGEKDLYRISYEELREKIREFLKRIKEKDKRKIYREVFEKFRYKAPGEEILKVLKEILENDNKN